MEFNETDLVAVGKIQEARNCTIENAKKVYRNHVQKLANQDAPARAELVLAAIERGVVAGSEEAATNGDAPEKPKKLTKNERRLAKRAAKEAKAAKKKAKAPTEKKPRKAKAPVERIDTPKVAPEREVELTPTDVPHVYTANLFGRKHAVNWQEINRTLGVKHRFYAVTMSNKRMAAVEAYAKENELPIAFCVTVRVLGKLDQGYAVPAEVFHKFKHSQGPNFGFALSGAARQAYEQEGWVGVKFSEKPAEAKAA